MNGEFVDNHKVWTIHSVAYDNTVQSGRSTLVRYEFQVPADAQGPLTITAKVKYRHLRQSYLNNIFGKDHPAYPVVELAARTRTISIGENSATAPDPKDNPDWMRWNNFGIACIDQFQYAEAINAFTQVIKLRPDYADGYTNLGLTNILWEKFDSARGDLEKALSLSPHNARALYYMAQIERREGNAAASTADLEEVVAKYPQSRDARRELGQEGPAAQERDRHHVGEHRREHHREQRVDGELAQDDLDAEEHPRDRRVERRGDAAGRAAGDQDPEPVLRHADPLAQA